MATTTPTTLTHPEHLSKVLYAAETGDVDTVRRYIESGGDPNIACRATMNDDEREVIYYEGETPLMVALHAIFGSPPLSI